MGVEPRSLGLQVHGAGSYFVGTPPIERLKGKYLNACSDVLVPGSNPQVVVSYF